MASSIAIKGGQLINEGKIEALDIYVKGGKIDEIAPEITRRADTEINAEGKYVLPGIIDDQVHFREPGLTHKADIHSESLAAVAGGVTSYMEMPNTKPATLTQELLDAKYMRAGFKSLANYSFYMGAANDNLDEVLKTNPKTVCGIKAFMGSSTGNMLVDDPQTLEKLFAEAPMLIATHCEDETTIRKNLEAAREKYGEDVPMASHPLIRSAEACFLSSSLAVRLAKKHNTRLHVLHLTTEQEMDLFEAGGDLRKKRITSEVCVHHLYFNDSDYDRLGSRIKCNPAIKTKKDQEAIFQAMLDDRIDVIATDHAPHTWAEKQNKYFENPSGLPLVQHPLNIMLSFYQAGKISLERIVEKMCHAPADCFQVDKRGYVREGFWADLVVLDPEWKWTVGADNLHYKCGWTPLESLPFQGRVESTIVSGHLAWHEGRFNEEQQGRRLVFQR